MAYLIWVNLYLTIFYAFYWACLRKETFFQINRWYFLSGVMLSFTLPLIDLSWFSFSGPELFTATLPEIQVNQMEDLPSSFPALVYVYTMGCFIAFMLFSYRIYLIKKSLKTTQAGDAYSFLHLIKVDPQILGYEKILIHEQVHAKQLHSLDVLIFEAIKIVNWFNPVVYLLIRAIKLNHEYIADEETAILGAERIDYANLLVSQTFHTPAYSINNSFFNKPILKKRIVMLFKNKSKKSVLIRFSLLVPIMSIAFACQKAPETKISPSNKEAVSEPSSVLHTDADVIFKAVEVSPQPVGGMKAFMRFVGENYIYPREAVAAKVKGRVISTFIIEKDGSLSNIKIVRDLGYGTGEEAIRVLENSPKWQSGIQNGRTVRVQFTLPILLDLVLED